MAGPDDDDLDVYRRRVQALTAETQWLRAALNEARDARRRDVRRLRAQLREGLSEELLVLRRAERRWRHRALTAESRLAARERGRDARQTSGPSR
jgi:hypothetical protein